MQRAIAEQLLESETVPGATVYRLIEEHKAKNASWAKAGGGLNVAHELNRLRTKAGHPASLVDASQSDEFNILPALFARARRGRVWKGAKTEPDGASVKDPRATVAREVSAPLLQLAAEYALRDHRQFLVEIVLRDHDDRHHDTLRRFLAGKVIEQGASGFLSHQERLLHARGG
jgi:hypothetical protein